MGDTATAMDTAVGMVVMAAMAVATTARGLLMPSPRLMLLLRLSLATDTVMVDMAAATTATARGLLSPATAMVAMAMVATVVAMAATATAGAMATGVSYHRTRRSELSQKQNHKNSQR